MALPDIDQPLQTTPTFTSSYTFSTADVTGSFDGTTLADDPTIIDLTAEPKNADGTLLYPIDTEFGFYVSDFENAEQKVRDGLYEEGWVGDLTGEGGEQLGIVISDAPTDTFKVPATFGTWLSGLGGNSVKASTEHYVVMQNVLSDQEYPGDPDALYPLDDNLIIVGGAYDGQYVADVLPLVGDVNGDGEVDLIDVLAPNETEITENIAYSSDYSVTLKDDGKLLYRWGNMIKKPNDVRLDAKMDLPTEWTAEPTKGPQTLYRVSAAELVIRHTVTNNPNDQVRPEDYENEAAIGRLPTYTELPDGTWVSVGDFYAGDGTFYPDGTVLKDPALAAAAEGSLIDQLTPLSGDLAEGFTNAWYTTLDRAPFESVVTDGEYEIGPRWRLKPDKYGQDLPGVVIPEDPADEPPVQNGEEKYEVGADTQTVLNLLDWGGISPLSTSAGFLNQAGTVSVNGVNYTEQFDVAYYVKGDIKPATVYGADLLLTYEEIPLVNRGLDAIGTAEDDILVGRDNNLFTGDAGADLFIVSYAAEGLAEVSPEGNLITDFEVGVDALGLYNFGVTLDTFDYIVTQTVDGGDLTVSVAGVEVATLQGVDAPLDMEADFQLINTGGAVVGDIIMGTAGDDSLTGTEFSDLMIGMDGQDTMNGLGGNDTLDGGDNRDWLYGDEGNNVLIGGGGRDRLEGHDGNDVIQGGDGIDVIRAGRGNDRVEGGDLDDIILAGRGQDLINGGTGADQISGGFGADTFYYLDGDEADVVSDFETDAGVDMLMLDAQLWGGGAKTAAQVLTDHANVVGTDLVFDFGGGDTMTLLGVDNTTLMEDNILVMV
ncbi:calcium-binding protein [Marimonas lutisalis]|uniref:calcium-binding protein n=1 Tax=Marimonas lutisalis TaxID=2545756 RepID=UPI0010F6699C|nr:calcium-binding protein [Marimonas lutisalis]